MRRVARIAAALLLAVVSTARADGAFRASQLVLGGNRLESGWWLPSPLFLHSDPTPPTGNTATTVDLAMDGTAPTATTLYWYDTCATRRPGRTLLPSTTGLADTGKCRYVDWRAPALAQPTRLHGTIAVAIWSGTNGWDNVSSGSLTAYLRDWDPSTGLYVELTEGTITGTNWNPSGTWTLKTFLLRPGDRLLPAGHRLELRLMALAPAAAVGMQVAYDVTAYTSEVFLR